MPASNLLLVPGLLCTAELFASQIETLSSLAHIVIADHTRHDSMAAIAAAVLAEAPERFALAGLSMGGYVALEIQRQAPPRVERLALLDTTARADTEETRQSRLSLLAMAEQGRFSDITSKVLLPRLVRPAALADRSLCDRVIRMAEEIGPQAFKRQETAIMQRSDLRSYLPRITCPTLVLVGADDILTPPELAREMAGLIPQARLVVISDSGHLSTLEQPAAVTETLLAWLRS